MTFNDYQKTAITTDLMQHSEILSAHDPAFVAKVLGLSGETGEVMEKFKKIIRDKKGVITDEDKTAITKELGDILWYVSAIADYMGVELDTVAEANIQKVLSRKERGVSRGSGDNR